MSMMYDGAYIVGFYHYRSHLVNEDLSIVRPFAAGMIGRSWTRNKASID